MLPLHQQIPQEALRQALTAHAGLFFDRSPDAWDENNHYQLPDEAKKQFLQAVIKKYKASNAPIGEILAQALNDRRHLVKQLNGDTIEAETDWRFVSGLGSAHPYETGFIWHRTLSVPYLPGSSVKGMMRAYATHWTDRDIKEITRLFGTEQEQGESGALIIFDALPSQPPELEIDILNPHYSDYYQNPNNPPADYLSPKPVFFLTVKPKQRFSFFLATRKDAKEDDLKTGLHILLEALKALGAGGKTAVGYGTFQETRQSEQQRENRQIEKDRQQEEQGLSGLEKQLKAYLDKVPEQEWDTCLLKALDEKHWVGDDARQVAEKIKALMIEADKWMPDFSGSNKQKLKLKERSLKVQQILENMLDQ